MSIVTPCDDLLGIFDVQGTAITSRSTPPSSTEVGEWSRIHERQLIEQFLGLVSYRVVDRRLMLMSQGENAVVKRTWC
jgi:hypothetical protein